MYKIEQMTESFVLREDVVKTSDTPRISLPYFTKYEYTTLLSCRAQQLADGALPLIPISEFNTNDPKLVYKIAEREILERKLPYLIRRKLPNNTTEYWAVSELELAW
jgi:DNA-directed RNA polymerase I, II, and III subunit RPABC2